MSKHLSLSIKLVLKNFQWKSGRPWRWILLSGPVTKSNFKNKRSAVATNAIYGLLYLKSSIKLWQNLIDSNYNLPLGTCQSICLSFITILYSTGQTPSHLHKIEILRFSAQFLSVVRSILRTTKSSRGYQLKIVDENSPSKSQTEVCSVC